VSLGVAAVRPRVLSTRMKWLARRPRTTWVHCVLVVTSVVWAFPLLFTFISGFKSTSQQYSSPLSFPHPIDWGNFSGAWSQGDLGTAFVNSAIVTVQSVAIVLVVATLAAYALACFDMRFGTALLIVLMVPAFVPGEVVLIPIFLMFAHLGLIDSLEGLVLANSGGSIAIAVLLLTQFFRGVSRELIEAATLDGATRFRVLRSVLLPLSRPALISVGIFLMVFSWNEFFAALILIQSPSRFTIQLAVNNYSTAYATNFGYQSAALGIATIPPLLFFILFQKHFSPRIGVRPGNS
jgi:ABC-type glycerol-3-phosphate transport system permease component